MSLSLIALSTTVPRPLVEALAARLERALGESVALRPPSFDPALAHARERDQHDALVLLRALIEAPCEGRVLGVHDGDLFIPTLTYVFGHAQLAGRAALVSTYRLDNAAYGLARDEALLLRRLEKETMHELGHTFGLVHCLDPHCVMHSSTHVEEIDSKSASFCLRCAVEKDNSSAEDRNSC